MWPMQSAPFAIAAQRDEPVFFAGIEGLIREVKPMPSARKIVIVGAGDHAKVVVEALTAQADRFQIVGLVDPNAKTGSVMGFPVLGDDGLLPDLRAGGVNAAVIGVGSNVLRIKLGDMARAMGFELPAIVHPAAWVSPSAQLGAGVSVMARAIVGTLARLEDLVILNSGAIVEHDNRIGAGTHIAPGATLAGAVRVGQRVLLGAGCTVCPYVSIGDDVVVGAGSVVVEDIPSGVTVCGVPARVTSLKPRELASESE